MHSHHRVSFLYILLLFQRASKTRFDVLLFVCSGRYYTLGDIYSGDIFTENKRIPQARAAAAAKPSHIRAIEPFFPFIVVNVLRPGDESSRNSDTHQPRLR
jgi:hypothetical protein